jgi:flagellar protein FlbD
MVQLTRLNHLPLVLNSDLIEYIETTPDTVITLTTGQKIIVQESAPEVVEWVVAFRRCLLNSRQTRMILHRDEEGASPKSEPA